MSTGMINDSNYRQAGTSAGGTVYRGNAGRTVTAVLKRSSASIPSKFETSLHQGTGEKHAFGSRVHRFRHVEHPLPGPGAYHNQTTLVRDAATCGSVSQRGYSTGFASKCSRFSATKEVVSAAAPGPGSYKTYNTSNTVPARDFRKSAVQAVFAAPTHGDGTTGAGGRGATASNLEVPGPGQYDHQYSLPSTQQEARRSNVVFKSSVGRFAASRLRAQTGPNLAPGAYDVAASSDAVAAQGRLVGGRELEHSAFKSVTERSRDLAAAVADAAAKPGPGAYDDSLAYRANFDVGPGAATAANQSSVMFANTQQDRFGRPYVRKADVVDVPGPGWYEAAVDPRLALAPDGGSGGGSHDAIMSATMPASSMFISRAPRMSDHQSSRQRQLRPPGPSFYKPERTNQKSFLLNTNRKWI